jgi:O-antigen ligase
VRPLRFFTTDRGSVRRACVCIAALAAVGAATPIASSARRTPIAIERVTTRAERVTVTWRAAESGRYAVWVGATYCATGRRLAVGRYRAAGEQTVVVGWQHAPPGARLRICLRTASGTLSDAVLVPPRANAVAGGRYPAWIFAWLPLALAVLPLALATAVIGLRMPVALLALYAVLIPAGSGIHLPIGAPAPFDTASTLAGLVASAGIAAHLVAARRRAARLSPTVPVWLLLFALAVIASLWSVNRTDTFSDLFVLASLIGMYVAASLLRVGPRDVGLLSAGIAFGGAIAGAAGLYQLATSQIALSGGDIARFRLGGAGPEGDPNITAASLLLPLAVGLGRGVRAERLRSRVLYLAAAALAMAGLVLTSSRGGLVAAVVLIAVLAATEPRRRIAAAYVLVPLAVVAPVAAAAPQTLTHRLGNESSTGRTGIWRVGLAACQQYCWYGSGWHTFADVHERVFLQRTKGTTRHLRFEAHNFLLEAAVELGFIGVALIVTGLFLTVRALVRAPAAVRGPPLAALAGILASNAFLSNFDFKYFWLALVYALIVANAWPAERRAAVARTALRPRSAAVATTI